MYAKGMTIADMETHVETHSLRYTVERLDKLHNKIAPFLGAQMRIT
jgi:hypothetical protein